MVLDRLDCDMKLQILKITVVSAVLAAALLAPEAASAFRCGNTLVKEGMHEVAIVAICGVPTSKRNLGYAVRLVDRRTGLPNLPGITPSGSSSEVLDPAEVMSTAYVYHLGPRKFKRRLVFAGGLLPTNDTQGRGYHE